MTKLGNNSNFSSLRRKAEAKLKDRVVDVQTLTRDDIQ
jgi:hypothetical protein